MTPVSCGAGSCTRPSNASVFACSRSHEPHVRRLVLRLAARRRPGTGSFRRSPMNRSKAIVVGTEEARLLAGPEVDPVEERKRTLFDEAPSPASQAVSPSIRIVRSTPARRGEDEAARVPVRVLRAEVEQHPGHRRRARTGPRATSCASGGPDRTRVTRARPGVDGPLGVAEAVDKLQRLARRAREGSARASSSDSRCGTFLSGSPPSRASTQKSAASSSGCHSMRRGPKGTPCRGVWSASGRSATVLTSRSRRVPDLESVREALVRHPSRPGDNRPAPEEDRCDVSSRPSPCSRVSWPPAPRPPRQRSRSTPFMRA